VREGIGNLDGVDISTCSNLRQIVCSGYTKIRDHVQSFMDRFVPRVVFWDSLKITDDHL
jgi:hypothetical protein